MLKYGRENNIIPCLKHDNEGRGFTMRYIFHGIIFKNHAPIYQYTGYMCQIDEKTVCLNKHI